MTKKTRFKNFSIASFNFLSACRLSISLLLILVFLSAGACASKKNVPNAVSPDVSAVSPRADNATLDRREVSYAQAHPWDYYYCRNFYYRYPYYYDPFMMGFYDPFYSLYGYPYYAYYDEDYYEYLEDLYDDQDIGDVIRDLAEDRRNKRQDAAEEIRGRLQDRSEQRQDRFEHFGEIIRDVFSSFHDARSDRREERRETLREAAPQMRRESRPDDNPLLHGREPFGGGGLRGFGRR